MRLIGSLAVVGVVLSAAFCVGSQTFEGFYSFQHHRMINLEFCHFGFDVAAVIVITIFSLIWNNTKFYQGYLALAPIVRYYFFHHHASNIASRVDFDFKNTVFPVLLFMWGARSFLTKFIANWKGLPEQNARATDAEKGKGFIYKIWGNLFAGAITIVLSGFLCLPIEIFQSRNSEFYLSPAEYSISEVVSFVVAIVGLAIQAFADSELVEWNREPANVNTVCDCGVRRYLRYPQYTGEFLFWVGVYGIGVAPYEDLITQHYSLMPIGLVLHFLWIAAKAKSNDRILAKTKKGWVQYSKQVRFALIPFFRK